MVVLVLVTFFAEIVERGSGQLLSPTIPTVLTRHSSPPLSAFRCKKRMFSQKERAESEVLAWRQALYCKEKNAVDTMLSFDTLQRYPACIAISGRDSQR